MVTKRAKAKPRGKAKSLPLSANRAKSVKGGSQATTRGDRAKIGRMPTAVE